LVDHLNQFRQPELFETIARHVPVHDGGERTLVPLDVNPLSGRQHLESDNRAHFSVFPRMAEAWFEVQSRSSRDTSTWFDFSSSSRGANGISPAKYFTLNLPARLRATPRS
jgi:hypothetical protein